MVYAQIVPKVGISLRVSKLPQADLLLWPQVCGTRGGCDFIVFQVSAK